MQESISKALVTKAPTLGLEPDILDVIPQGQRNIDVAQLNPEDSGISGARTIRPTIPLTADALQGLRDMLPQETSAGRRQKQTRPAGVDAGKQHTRQSPETVERPTKHPIHAERVPERMQKRSMGNSRAS